MASGAQSTDRFLELDSVRGIGACLIALFHVRLGTEIWRAPIYQNLGVFIDFFFLLSGFVITHTYGRKIRDAFSTISFMLRRFGRLWPLHAFLLCCMLAMELAKYGAGAMGAAAAQDAFHGKFTPETFLTSFFLLHGMAFNFDPPWNGPSWSISVEMWIYVLFAFACMAPRWAMRAGAIALAVVYFALAAAPPSVTHALTPIMFVRGLFGFAMGAGVYHLFQATRGRVHGVMKRFATSLEIACFAMLPAALVFVGNPAHALLAMPCFGVFMYVFAYGRGQVSRLLRWRPLVWLGSISYSIYMVHFPLYTAMYDATRIVEWKFGITLFRHARMLYGDDEAYLDVSNPWLVAALYAAFFAILLAAAWATTRWIEAPGRRFFRRHDDQFAAAILRGRSAEERGAA